MNWRVKGAIQKVLGKLPAGDTLHYQLQRWAGGLRHFEGELDTKVDDWRLMIGHLRSVGIGVAGTRFVEMGTGWYPTFPFSLFLAGARAVHTFDLNRHLRDDLTRQCADRLGHHAGSIAEASGRPLADVAGEQRELAAAMRRGATLEDATGNVIRYQAPADASVTGLPAGSVDVTFSNSVLEHVPGDAIGRCFAEAKRILRPGGVMFHSVNCGDHYAYVDRSISQLNYLQFSETEWQRWNNEFLYQNRLRALDFVRMARDAGFTIEVDTSRPHPDRLAQLDALPSVHPTFARYSREELAITSIDFIARA